MKPGDLVQIIPMEADDRFAYRKAQKHFMKVGIIVSQAGEHDGFHPHYRLWQVMVDEKFLEFQGMDLVVISETR